MLATIVALSKRSMVLRDWESVKVKLTNAIKQAILTAALKKAGINDRENLIQARYNEWAELVRVRYVTPEVMDLVNQIKELMSKVPECIADQSFGFKTDYEIYRANIAGQTRTVKYGEVNQYGSLVKRITPQGVVLTADDPLSIQLHLIDADAEKLKSDKEQIVVSATAVLNSATTDKKLIELWPEAIAFIPAAEKAANHNLPALPIAELNKMIGLP